MQMPRTKKKMPGRRETCSPDPDIFVPIALTVIGPDNLLIAAPPLAPDRYKQVLCQLVSMRTRRSRKHGPACNSGRIVAVRALVAPDQGGTVAGERGREMQSRRIFCTGFVRRIKKGRCRHSPAIKTLCGIGNILNLLALTFSECRFDIDCPGGCGAVALCQNPSP